ncbi:heme lyase CcmF/NrfE family subunit [bacterium]|nr:heme lyase CcmF/NrfE family subunit [bacterium]
MSTLGYQALAVSLALLVYAAGLYIRAIVRPGAALLASAFRATYAVFTLTTLSSAALLYALMARDFQLAYVAHYSNRSLSWAYTLAAFWAGQDGSLLLWTWLLALFSALVLFINRKRNPDLIPATLAVMTVTTLFFCYLTLFKTNPFSKTAITPTDGVGLNPLLQNPEMIFHPPALYIGFVGFTVPFAFAIAALINKRLDEKWIKSIRRWTLFSWLFLTIGNLLGMQWAYVELGWGGYWAWDPVENASFMPWLTGTAFLHSVIVQERKGLLKMWNLSLITLTFSLTIFGTFVTRSGLISSVHAFGVSALGPLFLGFLALVLVGSAALIARRAPLLAGGKGIDAWSSKESSFLINNLLFIALTVGVFMGTIMPSLSEWLRGQKIMVGTEFFDRISTPIGLAIFLLTGVCTLLAWGKSDLKRLLKNAALPAGVTAAILAVLLLLGVRGAAALPALAILLFSLTTTVVEFIRGARVRARTDQLSFTRALLSLALHNKRRYGGYIVHLGVLLLFLGITGSSAFSLDKTATLNKGDVIELADYRLTYQGLHTIEKPDREIHRALFSVSKDGRPLGAIHSDKHLHENFQPATEVGLRSTLKEDLYVILANYDQQTEAVTVSVLINRLVLWMWIGGLIMVLGALLALSPQSRTQQRVG